MLQLSEYASKLNKAAKDRYQEKIGLISNIDPFLLGKVVELPATKNQNLPPVDASDIVSYLVLQTSYITAEQYKAHKSLEAYNQFVCGWVKDVQAWSVDINGKAVITGRVRHSQRCNDTPLSCWMICEATGEICCAHCNCMAGLGEVCTHVAATLFFVEASNRLNGKSTCTQERCQWVIPAFQNSIPYSPVKYLDFTSAKGKKVQMEESSTKCTMSFSQSSESVPPDSSELAAFYDSLSKSRSNAVILSVVPNHSHKYAPKVSLPDFPVPLQSLYNAKYLVLDKTSLLKCCEEVDIDITEQMACNVEKHTREQSKSKLWHKYLIKSITYPEAFNFSTAATSWGCTHEKIAREAYIATSGHTSLSVTDVGLVLNQKWPHIGASPDGRVTCSCCGSGVVEVKCPYSHRNTKIVNIPENDKTFCLEKKSDNALQLKRSHAYYYQVQTQLFVCDVSYCDFVVCTFPDSQPHPDTYIERIYMKLDKPDVYYMVVRWYKYYVKVGMGHVTKYAEDK